jgi:hypothetical protein
MAIDLGRLGTGISTLGEQALRWSQFLKEQKQQKAKAQTRQALGGILKQQYGVDVPVEGMSIPEILSAPRMFPKPKEPAPTTKYGIAFRRYTDLTRAQRDKPWTLSDSDKRDVIKLRKLLQTKGLLPKYSTRGETGLPEHPEITKEKEQSIFNLMKGIKKSSDPQGLFK